MLGVASVFGVRSVFYVRFYTLYQTSKQFALCGLLVQVNLSVATETTAELERLLQDLSAPAADSNKYTLRLVFTLIYIPYLNEL